MINLKFLLITLISLDLASAEHQLKCSNESVHSVDPISFEYSQGFLTF